MPAPGVVREVDVGERALLALTLTTAPASGHRRSSTSSADMLVDRSGGLEGAAGRRDRGARPRGGASRSDLDLHDGWGRTPSGRQATVRALERLLPELRSRGFELVTVSARLDAGRPGR